MMERKSGNFKMLQPHKSPPAKKSRKERNRGKIPGTAGSTEIMEQQIWKEFPEDLFEAVIARLPVATFFRFRSVCRKWNLLVDSHSFSQRYSEVPQGNPWFYTITHEHENSGAIFDPSSKKWHHPSISGLPEKTITLPVASAGGLLCFLDIGHKNFYVCNPLTQSFKELPARPVRVWSRIAVGMTLNGNSTTEGYKILWLGSDGEHEVYDSVKDTWTRPGGMPSSIRLPLSMNFRSQPLSIDGSVYFMRGDPEGIVSYDMANGVWKQYAVPAPPNVSYHTLAECRGKIMLVGLLTKGAATCVCIWELQKMTLLWKEVDRMPNIWCLEFYGKHISMTCMGNKGVIMLSLRSRQMNRVVTYDLSSGEWRKVPACILPSGRKRPWIACGTAFHPSPIALA
ncbi:F-box domain [Macleaya cordata]|uniref:F-box domain n=1 Tax=Macleaya cordata TaxID=56857 RepID=A0A200QGH2_MACCD|nr:F-box domain [Macleaya cordata]